MNLFKVLQRASSEDILLICSPFLAILVPQLSVVMDSAHWLKLLLVSVCFTGAAIHLSRVLTRKQLTFRFNPINLLLTLSILFSTLSITYSTNATEAYFSVLKLGLLLVGVLYFRALISTRLDLKQLLIAAIILFALAAGLVGVNQLLEITDLNHLATYDVKSVFAHRNIFTQLLVITLPFSVFVVFRDRSYFRWIAFATSICSIFLIVILLSRAAWVALLAALGVVLLTTLFILVKKRAGNPFQVKRNLFIAGVALLSILIVAPIFLSPKLKALFSEQALSVSNTSYGSAGERIALWQRSWELIKEKPVLGHGEASWKIEIGRLNAREIRSAEGETFFQRAHNDLLAVWVETGIIGLLLLLSLFGTVAVLLFRAIITSKESQDKALSLALLACITSYFICSLLSFPKERIEHILMLSVVLSLIPAGKSMQIQGVNTRWIILPIASIATLFGLSRIYSETKIVDGLQAQSYGLWKQSKDHFQRGESFFCHSDGTSTPLSYYLALADIKLENYTEALKNLQFARTINPYHIHVLNNLGTVHEILDNSEEAKKIYEEAITYNTNYDVTLLNLAAVYSNDGSYDTAFSFYKRIDKSSTDSRYREYGNIILGQLFNSYKADLTDEKRKDITNRMINTPGWMWDIYQKSILNEINIELEISNNIDWIIASETGGV